MSEPQEEQVEEVEVMDVEEDDDFDALFEEEDEAEVPDLQNPLSVDRAALEYYEQLVRAIRAEPMGNARTQNLYEELLRQAEGQLVVCARQERPSSYDSSWKPEIPLVKSEDGEWCKWVDGVRYRLDNTPRPAYEAGPRKPGQNWIEWPLVNSNVLPQEVIIHILAYTTIYTAAGACTLVCKDWNRAVKRVPDELWLDKLYLEFRVKPHMVDPFTPFMYIKRRVRAVEIFRQMLEYDDKDAANPFFLLWKGFPFRSQMRMSDRLFETLISKWRQEKEMPRPSKGDKSFWSSQYKVAYQLGPFTEDEFAERTTGAETWRIYINKLLVLIGYLMPTDVEMLFHKDKRDKKVFTMRGRSILDQFSEGDRNKVNTEARVVAICSLAYFLKKEYHIPIRLSQRMHLLIEEGYEVAALKKYRDWSAERIERAKMIAKGEKRARRGHEAAHGGPIPASEPEIHNIVCSFSTGHYIDLSSLIEKGPWSAKYKPNKFAAVALTHPEYNKESEKMDDEVDLGVAGTVVERRSIKILVFQSGRVVLVGVKNLEMVQKISEDTKKMLLPFKVLGPVAEKELNQAMMASNPAFKRLKKEPDFY